MRKKGKRKKEKKDDWERKEKDTMKRKDKWKKKEKETKLRERMNEEEMKNKQG